MFMSMFMPEKDNRRVVLGRLRGGNLNLAGVFSGIS